MKKLYSAAGKSLSGTPWNTYPRPQLKRDDWMSLNGEWEFYAGDTEASIRVPFCPESLLSGIQEPIEYGKEIIYRRTFTVPEEWTGKRILLHFGAVNRIAVVRLNGTTVAIHDNGYLPFSAELTEHLREGENVLAVYALNDISHKHPWGKQKLDRGGMWYTPVSGIWQTVWLEAVPQEFIRSLSIQTGADYADLTVTGVSSGTVLMDGRQYPLRKGHAHIRIKDPILWCPENPYLYRFTILSGEDRIESYFALRTLSVKILRGIPRLCLNGKPYFFHGLLDQGYWSDGLYTPAAPEGFEEDILAMKSLGFNTLRKHIKIEPEQFYYDCDRLGMIVFQDMVNCGEYNVMLDSVLPTLGFLKRGDRYLHRNPETRKNFLHAMEETVAHLRNHPCICMWTIFNEGWGQFCADEAYDRLRSLDSSRFIDAASGWFHQNRSDLESLHIYFGKLHLGKGPRAQLLSEFGGYACKLPEHSFNLEKTYGYRKFADRESFVRALRSLYLDQLLPLVPKGLCGAIYTQVSDVEDETNGFLTFDRRVLKVEPEEFSDIAPLLQEAMQAKAP